MNTIIREQLEDILSTQIELQTMLLDYSNNLREAIMKRDLEDISSISNTIDQVMEKVESTEIERRKLVVDNNLGDKAINSIKHLIDCFDDNEKLKELHNKLKDVVSKANQKNRGNRIILEEGISAFKNNINLIISSKTKPVGYDYTGKNSSSSNKILLNRIG